MYWHFTLISPPTSIKNKMNLLFHASLPDDGIFSKKYNLKERSEKCFLFLTAKWMENNFSFVCKRPSDVKTWSESKINLRIQNWVLIWWVYGVLPMLAVASFHFTMEILSFNTKPFYWPWKSWVIAKQII